MNNSTRQRHLPAECAGKTIPIPKFESVKDLPDPMAVTEDEMKRAEETGQESEPEKSEIMSDGNAELIAKLLANPEMAALLKTLAKSIS